jgi:integrase
MAKQKRIATKYPGVFLVDSISPATGKPDQIIYIRYKVDGKLIEEKAGRTSVNAMSAAKANQLRGERMAGKADSNEVRRAKEQAEKERVDQLWTVERLWAEYDDANAKRACRAVDASNFKNHLAPVLGKKFIAELCDFDVKRVSAAMNSKVSSRTGKPLSDQTKRHVLTLLKRMLRYATTEKKIPCASVAMPDDMPKKRAVEHEQREKSRIEFMTDEQLASYVSALNDEEDQDKASFFRIMLLTGIRRTALLHLKWTDVNFSEKNLTLAAQYAKSGKTSTIPVTDDVLNVLRAIRRTESEFVWPGRDGAAREDFRRMGRRLRDKAGLPEGFRPCHGLRHTFASHLVSNGVDLYRVQELLTHSNIEMTQRYAKLKDDALRGAASVANSMLSTKVVTKRRVAGEE